jgi:hypothetical protein
MTSRTVGIVAFLVLWSTSTHGKPSVTGDEPYYLLVSHSLLVDHDLDLANNFAANDARFVGADDLTAGLHARVNQRGALWSTHDIGMSVLVLPAYAAGHYAGGALPASVLARFRMTPGRFAYFTVSVFLVGLTALGAALLASALRRVTSPALAAIVALVVTLSPPVLPHSFLVFPETPAFLVTCFIVWLALRPRVGPRLFVTAALALGVMPWIHRKFSFYVIALAVALVVSKWAEIAAQPRRTLVILTTVFALPHVLFHLFTWAAWGNLGGPQLIDTHPFHLRGIGTGAAGMLLDRSRGLIPYAPIYLLLPVVWWQSGRRFAVWLLPIAALFLPMAAFVTWDAGYSPAARFLVPLMPLAALPAALALRAQWVRRVAVPLLLLQLILLGITWNRPRLLWPGDVGDNRALNAIPIVGTSLNRIFPVINQGTWR